MKKINSIFLALIASLALFSCDIIPQPDNEPDGARYLAGPALEILSKDVVFGPQGGGGAIVVNTNETLTARTDRPWISASVSGNRVTLTVDRNESIESRYSTVTLRAGDATAEIIAQQFGVNSAYAWDDSYTFPYPGGELDLPYGELGTVWVDVSETPWVSAVVDEENHVIHFTVAKSIYNYERSGKVYVTITDNYVRELTFIQEANPNGLNPGDKEPMEFTIESAWKPYYVVPESNDQDFSTVGVEVTEGSHAGRYFIKVVPASEFNTTDPDELQLYLNRHAPEWAAASPLIHRASAEEVIDALPMGNYVVGAIGVDNDNKVNGSVAFTVFSVTKVLTPYEKFLGTWAFDRGGTEDVWTVTEKVPNVSYSVTGIDGITDIAVEAIFNPADNTISFHTQENLGEHTVSTSSGDVTGQAAFYGKIDYNGTIYYVTGNYTVFTISLNQDASIGTFTPGKVRISLGEFDCYAFAIFTVVGESAYSATNPSLLTSTTTIRHLSQGEGSGDDPGGDPDPGDGAYGKWIGSWNVGDVTLTISQKVKDKTYTVSGLEGYDFETRFVNGTMEFFYQDLMEQDGKVLSLYGIDDDGEGYIVEGDPARDGWLATASLDASGKTADLVGAEFDATYSSGTYHERIVRMLLLAYDGSDFYYASNDPKEITMPTKMTKASSASVMSVRTPGFDMRTGRFVPLYKTFRAGPAVPYKTR